MNSLLVCEGDQITFDPMFGRRQVVLPGPAFIAGTGAATVSRRRVCVLGDEKRGRWPAQYFIPGYSPGTGVLSIEALDDSQIAFGVMGREPLVVRGSLFTARFTPQLLAVMTGAPFSPDTPAPSMGRGGFEPQQTFVRVKG